MASKQTGGTIPAAIRIILLSHSVSLCILLGLALLRHDSFPHGRPLIWGVTAGIIGGLSLTCFYIALARGAMGTPAAISGLLSAAVPAVVSIVSDGSPGSIRLAGFLIAGVAIWMVSAAPDGVLETAQQQRTSTVILAIVSGTGFGLYFVALKMAGAAGVVWPMATARIGSISTCLILTAAISMMSRRISARVRLPKSAIYWALSTAILDTCGNMLFIAATRAGRLDVAAVLASLYPATTILLAGMVLKERLSKRQGVGMAIAAAAVAMITL